MHTTQSAISSPLELLLRERRRLLLTGTAAAVVMGVVLLLLPPRWESSALLLPRAPRGASSLLSAYAPLASLLGNSDGAASPAFLAEMAGSRDVLLAVLNHSYTMRDGTSDVRGTLIALFRPWGRTAPQRRDAALRKLEKSVRTNVSLKSGMLRITTDARNPELAQQITARLVAVLDSTNQRRLRLQAADERAFAEARVGEASRALAASERALQRFEEANRGWRQSPTTVIDYGRLQREVTLRQGAYAGLVQAAEQARMEELHSAPLLAVVEAPSLPSRPVSRHLAVLMPVAAVAGMAGMLLWSAARHRADRKTHFTQDAYVTDATAGHSRASTYP